MTAIDTTFERSAAPAQSIGTLPMLSEIGAHSAKLLEYRSDTDPDAEFIPKTIAGFALGSVAMFVCVFLAQGYFRKSLDVNAFWSEVMFMMGIVGVTTSLLLVGLKVRADHFGRPLFARHWLNSIGTGAASALMISIPWILILMNLLLNKYLAAGIWMTLMTFPVIAAKWTIAPHPDHQIKS